MKYLFLLYSIFCFMIISYSQCDNQVNTNPNNATNLALPDVSGQVNSPDSRYLNGFNWWADGFYPLTNMQYNPTQPYVDISNVQDPNSVPYYHYLIEALGAEEMNPQNGWELLMVNLGRYPDNITPAPTTTLREIPYIGLYNKYTGILRMFVQYGYNAPPNLAVDGLKINIFYSTGSNATNKSTILRLGNGKDNTLDQVNPNPFLTAICPPNGSAVSQWMSADFQLTYDPCVCVFPTMLSVQFRFFSETDFKLTGRGISVEDDLIQNDQIANLDFLSGVSADNKNGYIIYEKMASLAQDYIDDMEAYQQELAAGGKYNEQVEKKLLAVKIFKQVVNVGLIAATGSPGFAQFALAWPALVFTTTDDNNQIIVDDEKTLAFYGKIEEILGEYANTFISESLKKKDNPTEPVMPTVTLSEMQFSGVLNNESFAPLVLMSTPGSFKNNPTQIDVPSSNQPQAYPVYNQPVGVFSLLETPKMSQSKSSRVSTYDCQDVYTPNPLDPFNDIYLGTKSYRNIENRSQFKLASPLVYTFNPALDYTTKNVQAMYIIKSKVKSNNVGTAQFNNAGAEYKSKIYDASVNLYSSTLNTYNNELIWDYINSGTTLSTGYVVEKMDSLIYNSEFIPIDAFNNFVVEVATFENDETILSSGCTINNGNLVNNFNEDIWENFDIQIKLKVDVEFVGTHSNGNPHNYSYIFTYDVKDENIVPVTTGPFIPNISGSNSDLLQYPSNLVYSTTNFNGSAINGCELNGNTYTCRAWNNIEINGDINVSAPYSVNFIAGNLITVSPEAIVSPQSTLSILQMLDFSNPMPEASSAYVTGFCNGTNTGLPSYKGNTPNKNTLGNSTTTNLESEITEITDEWDFTLYPNPTTLTTKILFNEQNLENCKVELIDMMGKTIFVKSMLGNSDSLIIDCSELTKGAYLVKVTSERGSKVKQLIIR